MVPLALEKLESIASLNVTRDPFIIFKIIIIFKNDAKTSTMMVLWINSARNFDHWWHLSWGSSIDCTTAVGRRRKGTTWQHYSESNYACFLNVQDSSVTARATAV